MYKRLVLPILLVGALSYTLERVKGDAIKNAIQSTFQSRKNSDR